ncbi:MAG: uroporphyrinogen decarboxylase family protein [Anaerolineae bacterium]
MNRRERILATLAFEGTDRVALLGGWLLGEGLHQHFAGVSAEEYWRHPAHYAAAAERALGVDAMIALHVPAWPGEYRGDESAESFESYKGKYRTPEDVLTFVRALPSPQEALRHFDAAAWRDHFTADIAAKRALMGNVLYLPTLWEVVHPRFEWYPEFGYENYLMFLLLYPEEAARLFASEVDVCRRRAQIVAEVYRQLDVPPVTLIGTDITGRDGPMVSPALLEEIYFSACRRSLEPLREAGIRTVWHSDGVIGPLVEPILRAGVSGFQGFQFEYGVDVADIARHRTADGEKLTIFAGLSTAGTLRFGTADQVRRETEALIDTLTGQCAFFILPGNNILPDCPPENVEMMYRHAAGYSAGKRDASARATGI